MPLKDLAARKAYARKRYLENREAHIAAVTARRKAKGPGARKSEHRNYYLKHKEKVNAYAKKWAKDHPESRKAMHKRSKAKRLSKDRILKRVWAQNNPDKVLASSKRTQLKRKLNGKNAELRHRRKATKLARYAVDCVEKVAALKRERFCRWCCTRLTLENFSIDHIIPIARGGEHKPDNLAACCKTCNSSKRISLVSEWLPTLEAA